MTGNAAFHLDTGKVVVELASAPEGECFDVWIVESTPRSRSIGIESTDRFVCLGTVTGAGHEVARIETKLEDARQAVLDLDLVVVTREGRTPLEEGLVCGLPGLFERVWARGHVESAPPALDSGALPFALIVQSWTPPPPGSGPDFAALVAQGEQLFFEETFAGNGRTCGTCHPAENNLTLDPEFIANLHQSNPQDPLFVAEFVPTLMSEFNDGRKFEIPELMHEHALILENLDGFGDLKNRFVMRGVSHVFAQSISTVPPAVSQVPPKQRTGWSGDGAPGSGHLREFAIGAVKQHATRTLNRVEGSDFVLPTSHQLDALEAFQLSLGRDADPDLNALTFSDPRAEAIKLTFQVHCDRCHSNGGANSFFTFEGNTFVPQPQPILRNGNFNTGVEARLQELVGGTEPVRPPDGGFGLDATGTVIGDHPIANQDGSFGDKTFNSQSIIEAADTLPSFHNNLTMVSSTFGNTIEGAIDFYRTDAFTSTVAAGLTSPITTDQEVKDLGRLLRSLNAMENARSARVFAAQALQLGNAGTAEATIQRSLEVAHADASDGYRIQQEVGLNPDSIVRFKNARQRISQAQDVTFPWSTRAQFLTDAITDLIAAKTAIATP